MLKPRLVMRENGRSMLQNFWYLALPGHCVKAGQMLPKTLFGEPLLLARQKDGTPFAFQDICPHRGIPLHYGVFDGCEVTCCYHGWKFAPDGHCTEIPSLFPDQDLAVSRIRVRTYPCREVQGNIWVFLGDKHRAGQAELPDVPWMDDVEDSRPIFEIRQHFPCDSDHAAFGLMDPTHAAFVHTSWWWKKRARKLREKEKVFEPAPLGWRMKRHPLPPQNRIYKVFGSEATTEITYHLRLPFLKRGQVGMEMSAALFGVGYILGPRIATIMVSGTFLSSVLIIPAIAWWGEGREFPLYPETVRNIAQMSAGEIWSRYVRYIGAGAVATGGFIALLRTFPILLESFRAGLRRFTQGLAAQSARLPRTSQDLPLRFVLLGTLVVVAIMTAVPHIFGPASTLPIRFVGALVVMAAAFFFVTVSSRIVGLVGVTSNPTSGMTIATLMVTSFVFLAAGWTDEVGRATVLTIGCVVAIAASIAGDTSQDLKTGFLLGATPYRQQIGELLGVLTSATFVCLAVLLLAGAYGFGSDELPAPQATLMKLVIDGVLQNSLPWTLVTIGVAISLLAEAVRIPSLPFAVGVYLPETTMPTVFLGGLLRFVMERRAPSIQEATNHREEGILFGSGLVGGEGLMGVAIAAYAFTQGTSPPDIGYSWAGSTAHVLAAVVFGLLVLLFVRSCKKPVG